MQSKTDGSTKAPIYFVGEAYGKWEALHNRPFVGQSYTEKLKPWWTNVGLVRERDFFIDNCWDQGQPDDIDAINETEMRGAFERMHDRIAAHEGPDGGGPMLIVPTGNYALYALTGNGRVSFHSKDGRHERPGIHDWRGSALAYRDKRGRDLKVIPTLHPAGLFRHPGNEWLCLMDWARIAEDAKTRALNLPQTNRMIAPSKGEVREWMEWTMRLARDRRGGRRLFERLACSLDVETPNKATYETRQKESTAKTGKCATCGHGRQWHPGDVEAAAQVPGAICLGLRGKGGCACPAYRAKLSAARNVKVDEEAYLGCVGYSWDGITSLTVPTTLEFWQDPAVFADVMAMLRQFHQCRDIDFGGQNFGFDAWWCAEEGIPLWDLGWDLMKMHRVQRSFSEAHDLATQASVDTRFPFWKHEAKLPDEISRWSHNKEQLWSYNGTDNCAQRQLLTKRLTALQALGRLDYYLEIEAPIDAKLLEMSRRGIRADVEGRAKAHAEIVAELETVSANINALAKTGLIGKGGGVSNPKLKEYLYGNGTAVKVFEKPLVENTSKAAKCEGCGHTREKHPETPGWLCAGTKKQPCMCALFIAPTKPGKRVQTGVTYSGGLRLPVQYKKNADKQKVPTVDVVAIKRLMEQFPTLDILQQVGSGKTGVLRHRRLQTLRNFLKAERLKNGRNFAIFRQDTLLGRLSSSETPRGDGCNLQNIDRSIRRFYLPDLGDEVDV